MINKKMIEIIWIINTLLLEKTIAKFMQRPLHKIYKRVIYFLQC